MLHIIGIVIIVLGWRSADFVEFYVPAEWGRYANYGFTLVAFVFLGIFLFRGSWRQKIRFPMAFAAISSSRIATQARPIREVCNRIQTITTNTAINKKT